jgi:hypothetical protein
MNISEREVSMTDSQSHQQHPMSSFRAAQGTHVQFGKYAALNKYQALKNPSDDPPPAQKGNVARAEADEERVAQSVAKSSAQVGTYVAHPVLVKSGELKLKELLPTLHTTPPPHKTLHPLGVRFSEEELALVRIKAQMVGCTVNRYIRASALGSDYTPPHDPELVDTLRATLRELLAHGNNLNQIARQMNAKVMSAAQAEGALGAISPPYLKTLSAVRTALAHGRYEPCI